MSLTIAVCVKQVPDIAEVRINPADNTLMRSSAASTTNAYDLFAIEEAIHLQEKFSECAIKTIALSMGPHQARECLSEALALGVDSGVLLSDLEFAGSDTWATSLVLAKAIKKSGARLVICGKQATDGDTAQVGPEIATHLGWNQACYACEISELSAEHIIITRHLDYGSETLKIALPAVITVTKDINHPRLTELERLIDSWQKPLECWGASDLDISTSECGLAASPTRVRRIFAPEKRKKAQIITGGNAAEKAGKIVALLKTQVQ